MILFVIFAAVALFLLYVFVLIRPKRVKVLPDTLLCFYAHRGLHGNGVPENSLAAFELACRENVGIELDIQLSKDGEAVVFHDYTLLRMTGCDKKVCEMTVAELQKLSLSGTEQTIPTFAQVLELVNGRVPLLVELKGEDLDASLCKKAAQYLLLYGGAYCIESFNPLLIGKIKKFIPDVFCGSLYTNLCREKKKYSFVNAVLSSMALNFLARPNFIAYNKDDRDSFLIKLLFRLYDVPKFVWTVDSEKELSRARELGEYPIFERKTE